MLMMDSRYNWIQITDSSIIDLSATYNFVLCIDIPYQNKRRSIDEPKSCTCMIFYIYIYYGRIILILKRKTIMNIYIYFGAIKIVFLNSSSTCGSLMTRLITYNVSSFLSGMQHHTNNNIRSSSSINKQLSSLSLTYLYIIYFLVQMMKTLFRFQGFHRTV